MLDAFFLILAGVGLVIVGFLLLGVVMAACVGLLQGILVQLFPAKAGICPKCRGKHPKKLAPACERCLGTGMS